ncbi:uncharacterized protein V1518DRAFT_419829 [Limtongia smithiae]|uniref:uncharacterized protein n=1 Tax=Limtongia smithiae TaxID=1125753 RepID=UPI0034CE3E6D
MTIFNQPRAKLLGGMIKANPADAMLGKILEDWSVVVDKPDVYVETSQTDYSAMRPRWAEEATPMLRLW